MSLTTPSGRDALEAYSKLISGEVKDVGERLAQVSEVLAKFSADFTDLSQRVDQVQLHVRSFRRDLEALQQLVALHGRVLTSLQQLADSLVAQNKE